MLVASLYLSGLLQVSDSILKIWFPAYWVHWVTVTNKGPLAEAMLRKDLSSAENHKMEREKKRSWKSF